MTTLMSFKDQASASLTVLVESCHAGIGAILDSANKAEINDAVSDFTVLRTDFFSILSLLHASTTKAALALKPASPQYKAALGPIKEISDRVAALVHSILLMRYHSGSTMLKEYESVALNVLTSIASLAQTLLSIQSNSQPASDDYFVRTGGVHDLINEARKPGALSVTNREAVRKRWVQDHESFVDGAEELHNLCMSSSQKDQDDQDDQDDFGDGWDELGLGPSEPLTPSELARAESIQALIKLVVLLHKRVTKDVLSSDTLPLDNSRLDSLCSLSNDLLTASDDLISSIHSPQQLSNICGYLEVIASVLKTLRRSLLDQEQTLETFDSLSLKEPSEAGIKARKWFTTCFEQIDKSASKARSLTQS